MLEWREKGRERLELDKMMKRRRRREGKSRMEAK